MIMLSNSSPRVILMTSPQPGPRMGSQFTSPQIVPVSGKCGEYSRLPSSYLRLRGTEELILRNHQMADLFITAKVEIGSRVRFGECPAREGRKNSSPASRVMTGD